MKWEKVPFVEVVTDATAGNRKYLSNEYLHSGIYPIIDQGDRFIAGYTDENNVVKTNKPLVIFGDHTKKIKYVDFDFCLGADGVKALKASDNLLPKYLYYFLHTVYLPTVGYSRHYKFLKECKIPLPPLHIQQQISDILDKADALRRKDQQLQQKYDELAQAIFYDMFGDPVKNEQGWEMKSLKHLIKHGEKISYGIVQPGDEVDEGVPVIRVGDFHELSIRETGIKKVLPAIEAKYTKTRIVGDEILIACVGSIGKVALVSEKQKGYNIVRATARVRPNAALIDRLYLSAFLSLPATQSYFMKETRTVSQPTLNIKHIEDTIILLPPKFLQEAYTQKVVSVISQKQLGNIQANYSNKLFNGLLNDFFG